MLIRLSCVGENAKKINVLELVPLLEMAGAAAVTVHGAHIHASKRLPAYACICTLIWRHVVVSGEFHVATGSPHGLSIATLYVGMLESCSHV